MRGVSLTPPMCLACMWPFWGIEVLFSARTNGDDETFSEASQLQPRALTLSSVTASLLAGGKRRTVWACLELLVRRPAWRIENPSSEASLWAAAPGGCDEKWGLGFLSRKRPLSLPRTGDSADMTTIRRGCWAPPGVFRVASAYQVETS